MSTEFGTALIQQQMFVAIEFPPKTVWTDSLTFENVSRKEAEIMLKDMERDEEGLCLRLVFTPHTLEN